MEHRSAPPRPPPRRARRPLALLLAAIAGLHAGCRDGERPSPGAQVARATGAGQDRPDIELLDPGAEPRRRLRYELVEGAEETLVMRMNLSIQTRTDDIPTPEVETPPVEMTMRLRIADKRSPDQAHYTFALEAVEVEDAPGVLPEVAEAMRQRLASVTGMTGSADVDTRGFNWNVRMDVPGHLGSGTQQMMQSATQGMDQVSAPLPEEPVGQGARWNLRQTIEQNGVSLQQVTHFELVELHGDRGILVTEITQRADRQPMTMPGTPAGAVDLLELESTGTGRIHFDLDRLVPRSTLSMRSDYELLVSDGEGDRQTVETHVDMRIELASPRHGDLDGAAGSPGRR